MSASFMVEYRRPWQAVFLLERVPGSNVTLASNDFFAAFRGLGQNFVKIANALCFNVTSPFPPILIFLCIFAGNKHVIEDD